MASALLARFAIRSQRAKTRSCGPLVLSAIGTFKLDAAPTLKLQTLFCFCFAYFFVTKKILKKIVHRQESSGEKFRLPVADVTNFSSPCQNNSCAPSRSGGGGGARAPKQLQRSG